MMVAGLPAGCADIPLGFLLVFPRSRDRIGGWGGGGTDQEAR